MTTLTPDLIAKLRADAQDADRWTGPSYRVDPATTLALLDELDFMWKQLRRNETKLERLRAKCERYRKMVEDANEVVWPFMNKSGDEHGFWWSSNAVRLSRHAKAFLEALREGGGDRPCPGCKGTGCPWPCHDESDYAPCPDCEGSGKEGGQDV